MQVTITRIGDILLVGILTVLAIAVFLTGAAFTRGNIFQRSVAPTDGTCHLQKKTLVENLSKLCEEPVMVVRYGETTVECDDQLTQEATSDKPKISFPTTGSSDNTYTLLMLDPDAPGASLSDLKFFLHWGVTNIKGPNLSSRQLDGQDLIDYMGPSPPSGSGAHRYQFLLFETAEPGEVTLNDEKKRTMFSLDDFLRNNNICTLTSTFQFKVKAD